MALNLSGVPKMEEIQAAIDEARAEAAAALLAQKPRAAVVACPTTAATVVTTTATFPTPFPSGVSPKVSLTAQSGTPQTFSLSLGAVTTTTVEIRVYRTTGSGNVGVHYIAVA